MKELRPAEKYTLSAEEAAAYFHIGINKIRKIINDNPNADWIFRSGSHTYIKRIKFENLIDRIDAI